MAQRKEYNCPNCGAPIASEKCPYCGTVFWDFASIDMNDLNYLKIRCNGRVYVCRAYLIEQEITQRPNTETFYTYADNRPVVVNGMPDVELQLNFRVIPDKENILYRVVEEQHGKR